ncbi:hypothetical protein HYU21_02420 [Candidatus Woesearchaeota archaeon]|nr:hypothetical protein [Candidatus Woesearchaeota archaeon]
MGSRFKSVQSLKTIKNSVRKKIFPLTSELKNKYSTTFLISLFLITLLVRLTLSFSLENFSYDSYYHLRQVEHIAQTGLPLYSDPLSYGGRESIFLPVFYYLSAFFSLFINLEILAKILPNLLFSLLVPLIYFLSKKITPSETASLFSAGIAGFLPILFKTNSFIPESLGLPLLFLTIYFFLNINFVSNVNTKHFKTENINTKYINTKNINPKNLSFENLKTKRNVYLYLSLLALTAFTTSSLVLLILGFGVYALLCFVESKKISSAQKELILISIFFYLWSQLIFFKNILLREGPKFIWQNIPPQIILDYFPQFSITQALLLLSFIPFLAGVYVIYHLLFKFKDESSLLLLSLGISTVLFSVLRLIRFDLALAFLGLILAVLFSQFYVLILGYLEKTKLRFFIKFWPFLLLLLLLGTTVYPAFAHALDQERPSNEEVTAFRWLGEHSTPNSLVAAAFEEGHLITFYGQRKNFIDSQFTQVSDSSSRFKDLQSLYTTIFQTEALQIITRYNINYLILTPFAQEKFSVPKLKYLTPKCFKLIYNQNNINIYEIKCALGQRETN